jgi:hypothetical protein
VTSKQHPDQKRLSTNLAGGKLRIKEALLG